MPFYTYYILILYICMVLQVYRPKDERDSDKVKHLPHSVAER